MNGSILIKRKRPLEDLLLGVIYLSAFLAVGLLVGIIGYTSKARELLQRHSVKSG